MKIIVYIISFSAAVLLVILQVLFLCKKGYFTFEKAAPYVSVADSIAEIPDKNSDANDNFSDVDTTASDLTTQETDKDTDNENPYKDAFYTRRQSFLLIGCSLVLTAIVSFLLCTYSQNYLFYSKMIILFAIVSCAAVTDFKRHIIPNELIITGLGCRLVVYVLEFIFLRDQFVFILKNDGMGFLFGFVILFLVAIAAKNSLGFGDVKLYGIIGIMGGGTCTYATLLLCFLSCAIVSVVLMFTKKKSRKSEITLAPFILFGLLVTSVLGVF